jgi:hypothetical protein
MVLCDGKLDGGGKALQSHGKETTAGGYKAQRAKF